MPAVMRQSSYTGVQSDFLLRMAAKYIWWKTPEEAILYPQRILTQVMNIGVWDDLCELVHLFSEQELMHVLQTAEAGQFNPKSWAFWHCRLTGKEPGPMPERRVE